jgi:hypothetical protein
MESKLLTRSQVCLIKQAYIGQHMPTPEIAVPCQEHRMQFRIVSEEAEAIGHCSDRHGNVRR